MIDKQIFQRDQQIRDYATAVALGLVGGVQREVKFGHCPVTPAAITDVWEQGASIATYIYPAAAGEALTVEGNAADTQDIIIGGLNADAVAGVIGTALLVTVTLTGATPVAVPGNWLAVNRVRSAAAIGDPFVGPVLVKGAVSGNTFGSASADDQQSAQAVYMVPGDKVAVVNKLWCSINRPVNQDSGAVFRLAIAASGKVFRTQVRFGLQQRGVSSVPTEQPEPTIVGPLGRIKISAEPSHAAGDVSAEFSMRLVDSRLVPASVLASLAI